MSVAMAYDTHAFIKRLQSVGFTEEQAEVFSEEQTKLMEQRLVTKVDLEDVRQELKRDIEEVRQELKRDIQEVKRDVQDVKRDVQDVKQELKHDVQTLEHRLKSELIRWIAGIAIAQATFILAVLKLFSSH